MDYYLFIDESGDHGLASLNREFPVFLLCGVSTYEKCHDDLKTSFIQIITRTHTQSIKPN